MSRPVVTRTREEVIKMWVAALRSGEYEQARYQLNSGKGFCCLGVLCDLAVKDGGDPWVQSRNANRMSHGGHEKFLPAAIKDFVFQRDPTLVTELMQRNDSDRLSFPEIAAFIERELL